MSSVRDAEVYRKVIVCLSNRFDPSKGTNIILCEYTNSKLAFNFFKNHSINSIADLKFKRIAFFVASNFDRSNIEISGFVRSFAIHFLCGFIAKDDEKIVCDTKKFSRSYSTTYQ